jgi:hypothetical protein
MENEYTVRPAFLPDPPITVSAPNFIEAVAKAKQIFGYAGEQVTMQISRIVPFDFGLCG